MSNSDNSLYNTFANSIPEGLKDKSQWVLWKYENVAGRKTKIPYSVSGKRADTTEPATWASFEDVYNKYQAETVSGYGKVYNGLGFVFTADNDIMGIDWDHVKDPETGEWDPDIIEEIKSLNSYAEISPSGTGAHCICIGEIPGERRRKGNLEMYETERYFTVTGYHIPGTSSEIHPAQKAINRIYQRIETPKTDQASEDNGQKKEEVKPIPQGGEGLKLSDNKIIELCNRARNAEKFKGLYSGSTAGYPSQSEADLALCSILAFYTRNPDQIDRIFNKSGLYRKKWDENKGKQTYGERTISEALRVVTDTYEPGKTKKKTEKESTSDGGSIGNRDFKIYPYDVTDDGLFIEKETNDGETYKVKFSSTPATITTIGENLDTDTYLYKIQFKDLRGNIKELWKEPGDLLTRSGVIGLINDGFIFTEENSKQFYRYFERVISNNSLKMDVEFVASKNGWKKGNGVFIVGESAYTKTDIHNVLAYNNESAENYNQAGTLEAWTEGIKPLLDYDIARFQCYAAMAATILKPLGVGSFIVDNFAESGTSKTVRCYAAMSMLGNPHGLKINALSTNTGLEKLAEFNTDLPLFIDETSDNKYFKDFVYMLSNGKGKTRGTKEGGLRQGGSWSTVVLTTGERPIINDKAFSGQQVRVLEIHDTITDYIPETIQAVEETIKNNYGHIAELYFNKVFENLDTLKATYNRHYDRFPKTNSNLGERSKAFFAAIATAGELLESVFNEIGIPTKNPFDICNEYFNKLVVENPTVHYSLRALETAYQWAIRNRAFFDDSSITGETKEIRHEIYGWITKEHIDFDPDKLNEYLDKQDIDYTRAVQDWRDMGISIVKDGRLKYQAAHQGKKLQVIRIPINQIIKALNLHEDEKDKIKFGGPETEIKGSETFHKDVKNFLKTAYNGIIEDPRKAAYDFCHKYPGYTTEPGKEYITQTIIRHKERGIFRGV